VLLMDKKCELKVNMLQAQALFYLEENSNATIDKLNDHLDLD